MTDVVICVGSSCHLKGARRVVEELTRLVTERGLVEKVKLSGSFCMGRCAEAGVSVKVNGEIHFVEPENIDEFFENIIAGGSGQ
ncbi:MAG: (2Fe-2S) ferredoxin domain-containing protein [Synergistaceae bacterium]|nr:(2Fe-2S) ferredoxin domain-containing protein [Synergistaceae bacterium]